MMNKSGALDQLKLFRRSIRLLPALARRGAAPLDALAVAYNATFLFYNMNRPLFLISPKQILKRYTLSQIASFCEDIVNGVETGFNSSAPLRATGYDPPGYRCAPRGWVLKPTSGNKNFKEVPK